MHLSTFTSPSYVAKCLPSRLPLPEIWTALALFTAQSFSGFSRSNLDGPCFWQNFKGKKQNESTLGTKSMCYNVMRTGQIVSDSLEAKKSEINACATVNAHVHQNSPRHAPA